jgi:hypothetical protein
MSEMIPRMIMAVSLSGCGRCAFENGVVQQLLDTDRSHPREEGPSTLGAGTNGSRSATNDSAPGDFGPYHPGGTGCRIETVKVRSRTVRISTVGAFCRWTATIVRERYMIEYTLDTECSILHVQPKSAIEQDDFEKLANAVDPHIEATGGLAGLIIETPSFPGWKSLGQWSTSFALFAIITSG